MALIEPAVSEQRLDPPQILFTGLMLEHRHEGRDERQGRGGEVFFIAVGRDGFGFKQEDGNCGHGWREIVRVESDRGEMLREDEEASKTTSCIELKAARGSFATVLSI